MKDMAIPATAAHKVAHMAYPMTILILSPVSPAMRTLSPSRGARPNVAGRARPRQSAQGGRGLVECASGFVHAADEIGELPFGCPRVRVADRLVHRGERHRRVSVVDIRSELEARVPGPAHEALPAGKAALHLHERRVHGAEA